MFIEVKYTKIKLVESAENFCLLRTGRWAWERAHDGAVKREGVKISENESHQSKDNKKV